MNPDKFDLRFVNVKGQSYVRVEDMVAYLREIAGSEATDVRKRFESAAYSITARFFPCGRAQDIQQHGTYTKPFPVCDNPMCTYCHGIKDL